MPASMERLMEMAGMPSPEICRQFGMEPERYMQTAAMMQGASSQQGWRGGVPDDFQGPDLVKDVLESVGLGDLPVPKPKFGNPESIRKEALARSADIFEHYHMLRAMMDRFEGAIQKRWMKKGKEQRRKILNQAWGMKMATTHRPDFQAIRKEGPVHQGATKHHDAYMWPFINEEDLTRPRTMPNLLRARGRTPPNAFAASDGEAMHYGIVRKSIVPLFLNEHVMVFRDGDSPETYGRLVHWDDHPDAFNWYQTRKEVLPGKGLLILQSQESIYHFLVKCANLIMHEVESIYDFPVKPAPAPISEADTGMNYLAVLAAEAPYRPPANISFARIETLLAAARDASSDHLWALREDPGYFAYCVSDAEEHRQEMMKDIRGLDHPLFRTGKEDIVWARSVNRVIADAHMSFELWASLHQQAAALNEMKEQFAGEIDPRKDLPTQYLDALLRFQHYLYRAADLPLAGLKMAHAASPPLRHLYRRDGEDEPMTQTTNYGPAPNANPNEHIRYLTWLFRILTETDGQNLSKWGLSQTADELQRLMDSEAEVKRLVTSYLAAYISDISIVGECLRQIEMYQPWANTFEYFAAQKKEEIESEYSKTSEPWTRVLLTLKKSEVALGRHASLEDGKFHYPVEKRKTKENIEAMRRAEQALDTFWHKVDELLHLNIKSLNGLAVKPMLESRKLQRTPDWIEPKGKATVDVAEITKPLSEIYFDLERRTESTQNETEQQSKKAKAKAKTRGTAAPGSRTEAATVDPVSDVVFEVDQRALKVFKTLFYTPSLTGIPAEIPWPDFLHALVSIGFQTEKLYGSVWQFVPLKLDVERSIHFHEPHPSGKIPFRIARRHGRRLNRAYGWHGRMFVLAGKR